ncbi:MAG: NADH-quinone oxidoreductase subunit NuoN [Candidatus Nanopelagicales bacterium]
MNFTPPSIDYFAISPMIVIFGAAIVSVLVEAFAPRSVRRFLQLLIVFGALIASFVLIVLNVDTRVVTAGGSVVIDGPALLFQGSILILAILGVGLMAERSIDPVGDAFAARVSALPGSEEEKQFTQRGYLQTEIWPLTLFAVLGMLLFVSANDLLLMFVALEVISLPLYLMTGMARRRRLISQEAALKYFLLGVFASAFFLYGAALVYGYSGSINFTEIAQTISSKPSESIILLIGIGMLMVGPLFKIGAVPFHQWVPDVYQGAPTAVVGFMAATVKIAAFGALLRLLYVAFGGVRWDWEPIIWIVASASMILGSILALVQTDIKRLLGYSWIAQAGFILVGLAAASPAGLTSTKFYVISYGFATVGTFAVVSMVRDPNGEATNLANWAGLGRKSPIVAMALSIFLLGLAGIPLTSGFVSKFLVFIAAVEAGATWLVIIGVVASLIAAFFYVRVIVIMFFAKPTEQTAVVAVPSAFTTVALAASVAVTVILGVVPQPVLELLTNADVFIR